MRSAFVFAVCGSIVPIACAQQSQLYNEVSTDGGVTWSTATSVLPGSTVQVRVGCRLIGTADVLGLATVVHMPTLSNWHPELGDERLPFTYPGIDMTFSVGTPTTETSYEGRPVENLPQNTGRIVPFGASQQTPMSLNGVLRSFNDPGNILRFAASSNRGPLFNLAAGVNSGQQPVSSSNGFFSSDLDVVLFKYDVILSMNDTPRTLLADSPLSYISQNNEGVPVTNWFIFSTQGPTMRLPAMTSGTASITVIPTPGSTCTVLVAGLALVRRRRRASVGG